MTPMPFGGLEIDHELELGRLLLDWNIRRLDTNPPATKFPIRIDREQPKRRREIDNLLTRTEQ